MLPFGRMKETCKIRKPYPLIILDPFPFFFPGGLCALGGIFILTLPIPIVVNSFASYYKNRLWRNEVAHKKRERAKKRREMELLMRDNLLNILTVPGKLIGITRTGINF